MSTLEELGYNADFENYRMDRGLEGFGVGRVISEHKERYLAICHASGVTPVIILSKTDLLGESGLDEIREELCSRLKEVPVIPISNTTGSGYTELKAVFNTGKTYCMLGSSGVGKSSLLNNLTGRGIMKTGPVSQKRAKGRHITSHRELIVLDGGGIIIDNPGMREIGVTETDQGVRQTFDSIIGKSIECKYRDCTHIREEGCAVLAAVEKGEIDRKSYDNFLKMEREKEYFKSSIVEKRKKDRAFGKIIKRYKKDRNLKKP